jgi:hypothetical protein
MERMKAEEKRAKRQRNVAIFGDLARLGAQMYAANGGSTQVERFVPQTQIANERLAALRDKHAAQIESFARSMNAAKRAESADKNARMKAEMSYAQADAAARYKAAKDAADMQYKIQQAEAAAKQKDEDRKLRERIAADRLKSEEKRFAQSAEEKQKNARIVAEYEQLVATNPQYKVKRNVASKRDIATGETTYTVVDEMNPSITQMLAAIERAKVEHPEPGSGVLKGQKGEKKAPLWGSKKTDNKTDW